MGWLITERVIQIDYFNLQKGDQFGRRMSITSMQPTKSNRYYKYRDIKFLVFNSC